MRTVYGIDMAESKEDCFRMGEAIMRIGNEMSTPGKFPIDIIPGLRYLPAWVPGMQCKRIAAAWKAQSMRYRDQLYALGRESIVSAELSRSRLQTDLHAFRFPAEARLCP